VGFAHAGLYFLFEISFQESYFLAVYLGNFFVTLALLFGLVKAFNKYSHYVAWLYLLASGLKFGLFFLLLWPLYRQDGEISNLEKITFIIPYSAALFLETRTLITKLNKI